MYNMDGVCATYHSPSSSPYPLSQFQLFFEGVEALIAAGTKAEEVGFRLDYSRTELRKCTKEYPGKEVFPLSMKI